MGLLLLAGVVAIDNQCRNALFQTHWNGKNDIETFNQLPQLETSLKLCPAYNQRTTCCRERLEAEQQKYFTFWRQILSSKMARVQKHRAAVLRVKDTKTYQASKKVDLEQFHAAEAAFSAVLAPGKSQDCFSALLTYVAGMLCFGCKPDWFEYVVLDDAQPPHVVKVRIEPSVCVQLWDRCSSFGPTTTTLKQAVLDSALAKQAQSGMENLDMFSDQQALCDWAHVRIALHPFSIPTEADREAAPADVTGTRRLSEDEDGVVFEVLYGDQAPANRTVPAATAAPRRLGTQLLDVLKEGQLSGFDVSWGPTAASAVLLVAHLFA